MEMKKKKKQFQNTKLTQDQKQATIKLVRECGKNTKQGNTKDNQLSPRHYHPVPAIHEIKQMWFEHMIYLIKCIKLELPFHYGHVKTLLLIIKKSVYSIPILSSL